MIWQGDMKLSVSDCESVTAGPYPADVREQARLVQYQTENAVKITKFQPEIMTQHKIYPSNCNTWLFIAYCSVLWVIKLRARTCYLHHPRSAVLASSSSDSCWNMKHRYAQHVGCCARCWSQDTIENSFPASQPADYLHCILLHVDWFVKRHKALDDSTPACESYLFIHWWNMFELILFLSASWCYISQ